MIVKSVLTEQQGIDEPPQGGFFASFIIGRLLDFCVRLVVCRALTR